MPEVDVSDVADFFIDLCAGREEPMTNLRLNKMMYFAQGWHMATYGTPLFNDEIQAWKNGPVVPTVYHQNKKNGKNGIKTLHNPDYLDNLTHEQTLFLLDVYNRYKDIPTKNLVSMTHDRDSPWNRVYDGEKNRTIPQNYIEEYFKGLGELARFNISMISPTIPIVDNHQYKK